MVQSSRLKKLTREHMDAHPGIKYQQALEAVTAAGTDGPSPLTASAVSSNHPEHIPDYFEVLGISDIDTHDFTAVWNRGAEAGNLRIPVGYVRDGDELTTDITFLDLVEENRGGDGPHGAVADRSGSGKSYFLRGIVLALAALYGPDTVNLALVDFKGGSTFLGMDKLPHTAACLSNVSNNPDHFERFLQVLEGEMIRREVFITDEKGCKDIFEYREQQSKHRGDVAWPPLPHLLVIIDEFSEFFEGHPIHPELLNRVGRIGRSLGMHLLMSSQFIDEYVLGDLFQHLSYRYCLAVSSPRHSIAMVGTDAAAVLANGKVKGKILRKFTSDSGPVEVAAFHHEAPLTGDGDSLRTMADALIDRIANTNVTPARQLWTTPMSVPRSLASAPALATQTNGLRIRIGVLDEPLRGKVRPWSLDFGDRTPHYVIAGGSKSGKSTTLRTMVVTGVIEHGPRRLAFMLIDGADASLDAVSAAPNVAAHVQAGDRTGLDTVLGEIDRLIDLRTDAMAEAGHAEFDTYLASKDSGPDPIDPYGYIVVAIDNIGTFLGDKRHEQADKLRKIIDTGHRAGVHLVYTADTAGASSGGNGAHYSIDVSGAVQLPSPDYTMAKYPPEIRMTLRERIPTDQPGRSLDPNTMLQARVLLPVTREIEHDGMLGGTTFHGSHDYTSEIRSTAKRLTKVLAIDPVPVITVGTVSAARRAAQRKLIADASTEINAMIGQDGVKKQLNQILALAEVGMEQRRRGLSAPSGPGHFLFTGAPGVGKKHTAGILARTLHAAGEIKSPEAVIANRTSFIGTVEGETAVKTGRVFDSARGGLLLIEDAYDLVQDRGGHLDPFGSEAVTTLIHRMNSDRNETVVVLSGQRESLDRFLDANPRLRQQVNIRVEFIDLTAEDLWQHLLRSAERGGRTIDPASRNGFVAFAELMCDGEDSNGSKLIDLAGNARLARNVVEQAQQLAANRMAGADLTALSDEDLVTLTATDIAKATAQIAATFGIVTADAA